MKFTIFSTLCLGFASAALAATESEPSHELAERQMRDRRCRRAMFFEENITNVESYDGNDAVKPEFNLETRAYSWPGTCDRAINVCNIKWTEGTQTCRANCACEPDTCRTNNGYCTYLEASRDCICS